MQIVKEKVEVPEGKSYKWFKPSLKHYFYWHYHPEIELVYVEAISGIRHVGKHVSSYVACDLILIGSNIPHLNFDYGLQTEYKQIVVQFREDFQAQVLQHVPELTPIAALFGRAHFGLSFYGETRQTVIAKLRAMEGMDDFNNYIEMLSILKILAESTEFQELNREDTSVKSYLSDKVRMTVVYNYIHDHYHDNPDVNQIAERVHLSTAAFCRYFKKQTDMTFTDFINQYRISQAKTLLLNDTSISEVCFSVGISSISYFNKLFKRLTGETPTSFKNRYRHTTNALGVK
ncbi:MAG TPA: AraC family transcriptional regulator, partial [Dyadobacter sp.]|nr:AraC family transcriptional regulator [Dyadobacter sp.]